MYKPFSHGSASGFQDGWCVTHRQLAPSLGIHWTKGRAMSQVRQKALKEILCTIESMSYYFCDFTLNIFA